MCSMHAFGPVEVPGSAGVEQDDRTRQRVCWFGVIFSLMLHEIRGFYSAWLQKQPIQALYQPFEFVEANTPFRLSVLVTAVPRLIQVCKRMLRRSAPLSGAAAGGCLSGMAGQG